jgi:hypothetical protein
VTRSVSLGKDEARRSVKLVQPEPEPRPRAVTRVFSTCPQCAKTFDHARSTHRRFCSYQCHLDSGGAFRAGLASAKATMRYGAKKDANHAELLEEMRKHCPAYDLSTTGHGVPDGIAWVNESWQFFDIKNPKTAYGRRGLNNVQKKWIGQWQGGPVYLLYTVDEARRFALGQFDGLKRHESAYTATAA